ncbi:MAG: hypothetical protein LBE18_01625 [Planctomycetaceae bacterium]|jgi:hypothetical protein|nr:hypothetical protein [Planctomycetaceae bacterium]
MKKLILCIITGTLTAGLLVGCGIKTIPATNDNIKQTATENNNGSNTPATNIFQNDNDLFNPHNPLSGLNNNGEPFFGTENISPLNSPLDPVTDIFGDAAGLPMIDSPPINEIPTSSLPSPLAPTPTVEPSPLAPTPTVEPPPLAPTPTVEPSPLAPTPTVEPSPLAPTPTVEPSPLAPTPTVEPSPLAPTPTVEPSPLAPTPTDNSTHSLSTSTLIHESNPDINTTNSIAGEYSNINVTEIIPFVQSDNVKPDSETTGYDNGEKKKYQM